MKTCFQEVEFLNEPPTCHKMQLQNQATKLGCYECSNVFDFICSAINECIIKA